MLPESLVPGVSAQEASVFTRLEKLLDQRDFGHPQIAASMLMALLGKLGYVMSGLPDAPRAVHPRGRKAVFVGDKKSHSTTKLLQKIRKKKA